MGAHPCSPGELGRAAGAGDSQQARLVTPVYSQGAALAVGLIHARSLHDHHLMQWGAFWHCMHTPSSTAVQKYRLVESTIYATTGAATKPRK